MSDAPDSVMAQIQKLFQLAAKNTNENESAAAMAKGQELLEKYNLTYEAVSSANVGSGAREKTAVEGGYYAYERELYKDIANLNFCLYWFTQTRNSRKVVNASGRMRKYTNRHNIVGRKVNVAATNAMADYLLKAATRLTYERTRGDNDSYRFDNWANSYRKGIVAQICRRLRVRRHEVLREEEAREAAEYRHETGGSTSTAISLSTFIDKETDANLDFIYGEGYSAAKAAERAEQAMLARRRERGYVRWAVAHPEEAAAREKALKRRERRQSKKTGSGRHWKESSRLDYGAYWAGYDDGEHVSLDQQVDTPKPSGLL